MTKRRLSGSEKARLTIVAAFALLLTGLYLLPVIAGGAEQVGGAAETVEAQEQTGRDDDGARAAFGEVYKVLTHPRCMNCHPAGNVPLNGDDKQLHAFLVRRGADGKGVPGMRCTNCHQVANAPGEHAPPGVPDWHMPPAETPMVFEGRTIRQLCEQLKDPAKTGGRTLDEVLSHLGTELVLWGWEPGDGRTTPHISHEEFIRQVKAWRDKGGACPE